ncbi:Alpha/beta hydrolase fold-1 [Hypoxylon rubiginosum]|uniref:Alpha/beta hydrolase fold-1 n=1 Tax=Hypoxylon rubiginosum TaxID=110542 RepID=A0ACC0CRG0_9PEZI|nr:Alpha/beta hydrolase fold-1 [Hypoxylon rubiginosum]
MAEVKPTLILIHGAWHTPNTYSKFTTALKLAGYEVHVPALPSMNQARPPNADLYTDTALIRSYVESLIDAGRTVVAIMHSYGGMVGTNALCGLGVEQRSALGLAGGVSHLIYICGFALAEGQSIMTVIKNLDDEDRVRNSLAIEDDGTSVYPDPRGRLIGEDVAGASEAEIEQYVLTLGRWNAAATCQELAGCAWKEIPVSYIHATQDLPVPMVWQKDMVEKMRAQGREVQAVELNTGHCPNLTMTEAVVAEIEKFIA